MSMGQDVRSISKLEGHRLEALAVSKERSFSKISLDCSTHKRVIFSKIRGHVIRFQSPCSCECVFHDTRLQTRASHWHKNDKIFLR